MKQKLTIWALIASLVLTLGLLVKSAVDKYTIEDAFNLMNQAYQEANLEKGKAATKLGDAEKYIDQLEEGLQDEIRDLDAAVTSYTELEAAYRILEKKKKGTTTVVEGPPVSVGCENTEFQRGMVYEAITEKTLVPLKKIEGFHEDHRLSAVGLFLPHPNDERNIPFFLSYVLDLKSFIQLVEVTTPSGGKSHYVNMWELDEDGNKIKKWKPTRFEVVSKDWTTNQFYFWAPHIDAGVSIGSKLPLGLDGTGSLGVSIMGYGRTKNDLDWRFARLSIDVFDGPGLGFTPVLWNVGTPLPLFSDVWLAPHIVWSGSSYVGLLVSSVL